MATAAYQKLVQVGTKIVAVGRNYAAHAKELGNAVPKVRKNHGVNLSPVVSIFNAHVNLWFFAEHSAVRL